MLVIDKMKVKRELGFCTCESELYTYINNLANQCQVYADIRKVKLKVNKTFGYVSCQTNGVMMTSALQILLMYIIDATPYGGCVNMIVSYHVDTWSLRITNSLEKEGKKWIALISRLISLYDYGNLRMIRNLIHLCGGKIIENRQGHNMAFQITVPIRYHCSKIKCSVVKHLVMKKIINISSEDGLDLKRENIVFQPDKVEIPHILLVVTDNELKDYLSKILSVFFRITISGSQEEVLFFIVQQTPDLVIIDENVGGICGEELCCQIKSRIGKFDIPVILLVNSSKTDFSNIECGADKLEIRTVSICKLKADIQELIDNHIAINKYIEGKLLNKSSLDVVATVPNDDCDIQFMNRVHHFLEENLSIEGYTIEMLSVDMGMSRTGFYNKIKGLIGKPPAEYIYNFKMEKAKILLATRQYKITEIASLLGFCDGKYFGKRFKKIYKMSPTDYLKSLIK